MKKIYVCNDTITGIFSAIYDAWKEGREEKECGIAIKDVYKRQVCGRVSTTFMMIL